VKCDALRFLGAAEFWSSHDSNATRRSHLMAGLRNNFASTRRDSDEFHRIIDAVEARQKGKGKGQGEALNRTPAAIGGRGLAAWREIRQRRCQPGHKNQAERSAWLPGGAGGVVGISRKSEDLWQSPTGDVSHAIKLPADCPLPPPGISVYR